MLDAAAFLQCSEQPMLGDQEATLRSKVFPRWNSREPSCCRLAAQCKSARIRLQLCIRAFGVQQCSVLLQTLGRGGQVLEVGLSDFVPRFFFLKSSSSLYWSMTKISLLVRFLVLGTSLLARANGWRGEDTVKNPNGMLWMLRLRGGSMATLKRTAASAVAKDRSNIFTRNDQVRLRNPVLLIFFIAYRDHPLPWSQDDLNRYAGMNLRRREALHEIKELKEWIVGMQDAVNEIAIMDENTDLG